MAVARRQMLRAALPLLWPALALANLDIPYRAITPGVRMPVISIGTGGLESKACSSIVRNWLSLGGRGVDTALVYRDQRTVAETIAASGIDRSDIFITTKIPGCAFARASIEADLRQLNTSYIDLMLIHFPRGNCSEAWEVLEDFHARGVLKAIGVSNFRRSDFESLLKTAKVVPAVNQIQHNILEHDDDTIAFCQANNITVEAYSPLGRAGHSGDIAGNKAIQGVAAKHGVSVYQVALKWILQHGHMLTFQSTSAEHQQQDADLFSFSLSDAEMSMLDGLRGATPTWQEMFA